MYALLEVNLRWIMRDRIFRALIVVSLFLIMLVPTISPFSMRQTQELAVTLSLSFTSFIMLVFSLLLGSNMVWRDIERRYTYAVLSLPQDRATYLVAKFSAVALFLAASALVAGVCSALAIKVSILSYPSTAPVQWQMIALAIGMDFLKYTVLAAIALLVSTVSTSFFMPFFTALGTYLAGSASQEVYEFITGSAGLKLPLVARTVAKIVYYIVPNFGAFDCTVQAVYPVPFDPLQHLYVVSYFLIYTTLTLSVAIWVFSRREIT